MGTDIHGVFQRFNGRARKWVDVPSNYEFGRHYQLFAVLAGVRNGRGFAGVSTGDPVVPIAEPRGLPEDFEVENGSDHAGVGMGDHTYSWLTGEEILAWRDRAPEVTHHGILSRREYDALVDRTKPPDEYSSGVWGRDLVIVSDTMLEKARQPKWTHIRYSWKVSLKDELAYFFDEVDRLAAKHGKIRFVFGFDS